MNELTKLQAENEKLKKKVASLSVGKGQRIRPEDMQLWKTVTWDLETTSLNADFGHILCCSFKPLGGPVTTLRIDQYKGYDRDRSDDKQLVKDIAKELSRYVIDIGYNSVRFDIPFLVARMLHYGLDIRCLRNLRHLDVFWAVRYRMRLRSARLEVAIEHLQASEKKTPLIARVWQKAGVGHKPSLDQIVKHNVQDVKSLEEVALKMANLMDLKFFLVR